jgi:hypothetical protein
MSCHRNGSKRGVHVLLVVMHWMISRQDKYWATSSTSSETSNMDKGGSVSTLVLVEAIKTWRRARRREGRRN